MTKKMKKSTKLNSTSIIIGAIGILVIVFILLFVKTEWMKRTEIENVKGETTNIPAVGRRVTPPIQKTAKAGEACGKSIGMGCQRELICAPLAPAYKLLKNDPTNAELTAESESVTSEEQRCIGIPENQIKSGCVPYIPYYGACVKKGVWPLFLKLTPTSSPRVTPRATLKPTPSPTSTPSNQVSCRWCGSECVDENYVYTDTKPCNGIAPGGYKCVNINNVCTKIGSPESEIKQPGKPLPDWWPF